MSQLLLLTIQVRTSPTPAVGVSDVSVDGVDDERQLLRLREQEKPVTLADTVFPEFSIDSRGSRTLPAGKIIRECVSIKNPTTLSENTRRIQEALDKAPGTADQRGCVSVEQGDWLVQGIKVPSNTTFQISSGARLVSKINVTKVAVVHVDHAEHVTLCGGGSINGHAEEAWSYFSDKDARMAPVAADGSTYRPHALLISSSNDIHVHHLHLHNATDWTFRMDSSSNVFVDTVDIFGDQRFPNNDGFDPESCTNVTLINSHISVADDGICVKANAKPLQGLVVRNTTIRSRS